MMLKVYDKNATDFTNNGFGPLQNAQNVKISREINGEYTLSFSLPGDDSKWEYIQQRNIVLCEGQRFRIYRYGQTIDGNINKTVDCLHVITDAAQKGEKFIPDFPDCIGFTPRAILLTAFAGTSFHVMTETEVSALGMSWVTDLTDIFECSKTYPLEIVKKVIESIGKGELYIDNYNIALVNRIGKDTGLQCTLSNNLQSIGQTCDGESIVTRLYALGKDGLPLPADVAPNGYIDSPEVSKYGVCSDYMDFDTEDPEELLEQALWQFSPDNPKRIDMQDDSYTIKLIELYKLFGNAHRVNLGDSIKIINKRSGIETTQRIIKYTYYPYSANESEITLGRPPKTYMDVLKESYQTTRKFNQMVNQSGEVKAEWLETLIGNLQQTVNSALKDVSLHKKGDLWEFGNQTAIAIVDGILAIANERNPDGTWNFRTFGDGSGFTADLINVGKLKAIEIEGCTITGGTLIGAIIKTAEGRSRTEIQPSGWYTEINQYDDSNVRRMKIGTNFDGGSITFYDDVGDPAGVIRQFSYGLNIDSGSENLSLVFGSQGTSNYLYGDWFIGNNSSINLGGATDTFESADGKIINVANGIITNIE